MLLTLCAVPKAFTGETATIQHNALRSWAALEPRPRIVLAGDEDGVEAAAREWGARHEREIEHSEFGTPLLHSILATAGARADGGVTCFVNADVMLFGDFAKALAIVAGRFDRFLMVGRGWRLDSPASTSDLAAVREAAREAADLRPTASVEYFAYSPPGLFGAVPPFAIGRYGGYDLWLLWRARDLGTPVVNASRDVVAVHQEHGYDHIDGGVETQQAGPEAVRNRELLGWWTHVDSLRDARYLLDGGRLRRNVLSVGAAHHRAWMLKRRMRRAKPGEVRKAYPGR
jgi:hypothetical protein